MKYPEYIYEAACQRLDVTKEEVDQLNSEEVFQAVVGWEFGYSSWASRIQNWIKDIYKIDLPNQSEV